MIFDDGFDSSSISSSSHSNGRRSGDLQEDTSHLISEADFSPTPVTKSRLTLPSIRTVLLTALAVYWGISLCFTFASILSRSENRRDPEQHASDAKRVSDCDCGTSIAVAVSRGCIYDALAAAWLPPSCRDDELTAEFNRSGPGDDGSWPYWTDKNATIALSMEDIAAMGDTGESWYSTKEWHVVHCNFYWRKAVRMKDTGIFMETRYAGIHHVRHCSVVVLDPRPLDSISAVSGVALISS